MRPLVRNLAAILVLGATLARAQNAVDGGSGPQLPVGQVFKQFEFPIYQNGVLKATLDAVEARGITLNRAETTDLTIVVYDNGVKTTTITSPKADLYVNEGEQKMRTKNTVQIKRADMEASAQSCDFDVKTKKYVLRTNVKVLLTHFSLDMNTAGIPSTSTPAPVPASSPAPAQTAPATHGTNSMLDTPGAFADPNAAPVPPPSSDTK